MGDRQKVRDKGLSGRLYEFFCGRELGANILHFQFLPSHYARRDIGRDGPGLRGRVLDVGCGNQPYRPYLDPGVTYVGLEYPPARERHPLEVPPTVYGDARRLPFATRSFDGVLCLQMLEHVPQPEEVIREIARILKPGGVALLSVPFFYNLHLEPDDFLRFSPHGLRNLLESNGFALRQLRGQGGIGTLLIQLFHNWLYSTLSRAARRHGILKVLLAGLLPLLVPLTVAGNLLALLWDRVDGQNLRFAPNLWAVAERLGAEAGGEVSFRARG